MLGRSGSIEISLTAIEVYFGAKSFIGPSKVVFPGKTEAIDWLETKIYIYIDYIRSNLAKI
jgi:hypothetical protein